MSNHDQTLEPFPHFDDDADEIAKILAIADPEQRQRNMMIYLHNRFQIYVLGFQYYYYDEGSWHQLDWPIFQKRVQSLFYENFEDEREEPEPESIDEDDDDEEYDDEFNAFYAEEVRQQQNNRLHPEIQALKLNLDRFLRDMDHLIPKETTAADEIAFIDGVFSLRAGQYYYDAEQVRRDPIRPAFIAAQAQCPQWLACLSRWFGARQSAIEALQEYFGYCLMEQGQFQRALYCYGHPDKAVIARLLIKLVGNQSALGLDLDKWSHYASLEEFARRRVNIAMVNEARLSYFYGPFARIISGIPQWVPGSWVVPTCRQALFAGGAPPSALEATKLMGYLLPIELNPEALPMEIAQIESVLAELPGILNWALDGAARLYQQGRFTKPERIADTVYTEENPVAEFIADYCKPAPGHLLPLTEFRTRFLAWHGSRLTPNKIGRLLSAAGYTITRKKTPPTNEHSDTESSEEVVRLPNSSIVMRYLTGFQWADADEKQSDLPKTALG